jgi:hypothetical protein
MTPTWVRDGDGWIANLNSSEQLLLFPCWPQDQLRGYRYDLSFRRDNGSSRTDQLLGNFPTIREAKQYAESWRVTS